MKTERQHIGSEAAIWAEVTRYSRYDLVAAYADHCDEFERDGLEPRSAQAFFRNYVGDGVTEETYFVNGENCVKKTTGRYGVTYRGYTRGTREPIYTGQSLDDLAAALELPAHAIHDALMSDPT